MWARELPAHGCAVSEPRSRRAHPKHRECAQGTSGWKLLLHFLHSGHPWPSRGGLSLGYLSLPTKER